MHTSHRNNISILSQPHIRTADDGVLFIVPGRSFHLTHEAGGKLIFRGEVLRAADVLMFVKSAILYARLGAGLYWIEVKRFREVIRGQKYCRPLQPVTQPEGEVT